MKLELEVSPEDFLALLELAHDLKTQHNDWTKGPVFLVQSKRVLTGFDPSYGGPIRWIDEDGNFANAEVQVALEAGTPLPTDPEDDDGEEVDPDYWTRTSVVETWETIQWFLTRKAAEAYRTTNAHRLEEPRIVTDSSYRNHEIQLLQRILPLIEKPC